MAPRGTPKIRIRGSSGSRTRPPPRCISTSEALSLLRLCDLARGLRYGYEVCQHGDPPRAIHALQKPMGTRACERQSAGLEHWQAGAARQSREASSPFPVTCLSCQRRLRVPKAGSGSPLCPSSSVCHVSTRPRRIRKFPQNKQETGRTPDAATQPCRPCPSVALALA